MKRLTVAVGLAVLFSAVMTIVSAGASFAAPMVSPAPLTGTYAGTVVITSPLGLDPFDMAIVLTDTNGTLSGYIDSARLLAYPVTQMTPFAQGPAVSGLRTGNSFVLQSTRFTDTISTVSRRIVLHTGVISNSGETLTGVYSETLWGLTPAPLLMVGSFSLARPSNLPPSGQPVELHVRSAPIHIQPQGVATVTAQLVDFYSQPISRTVISFAASSGTFYPATAATNLSGEASVKYTASAGIGPVTVTATSGAIRGATTISKYIPFNYPVYLPIIRR